MSSPYNAGFVVTFFIAKMFSLMVTILTTNQAFEMRYMPRKQLSAHTSNAFYFIEYGSKSDI